VISSLGEEEDQSGVRVAKTRKAYFFVGSKSGQCEQHELIDDGNGRVSARKVRSFKVGSQAEGFVADDELGVVYVGEECRRRELGVEPDAGDKCMLLIKAGQNGLKPDVEGLALYCGRDGKGYLIVSRPRPDLRADHRPEGGQDRRRLRHGWHRGHKLPYLAAVPQGTIAGAGAGFIGAIFPVGPIVFARRIGNEGITRPGSATERRPSASGNQPASGTRSISSVS
jgi:hypothetical protein